MATPTPDSLVVASERAYVVYRARSGQIVHVHEVVTFRGAEGRSEPEEQARALDLAARLGHTSGELRAMPVTTAELEGHSLHQMLVRNGRLATRPSRSARKTTGRRPPGISKRTKAGSTRSSR